MAIIFFSIAESTRGNKSTSANWVLLLLSFVTILVNGIALSAILFRISEWGITPNRTAVLGGNILILVNLLLVTFKLYNVVQGKAETEDDGKPIPVYIPVYALWAIIVVFFSPLLFGFK
ncbi:hypothetical protein ACSX1A_02460 [Pontibacter sp. MBLB2868]|uniref:hypothetical protein n=1 Tax=Pontibacter sp. MBLB2868 TaxID=3451555 RepID=UPI003F7509DE